MANPWAGIIVSASGALATIRALAAINVIAQRSLLKAQHLRPPIAIGHSAMLASSAEKVELESRGWFRGGIFPAMHFSARLPAMINRMPEASSKC